MQGIGHHVVNMQHQRLRRVVQVFDVESFDAGGCILRQHVLNRLASRTGSKSRR